MRSIAIMFALAACGGDSGASIVVDAPNGVGDAPPDGCTVSISFEPAKPLVGQTVRLRALVTGAGVIQDYAWTVQTGATMVPTQDALPDRSEVTFVPTIAGNFGAQVVVTNAGPFCFAGQNIIEVKQPGSGEASFRFHVLGAAGDPRPPLDDLAIV